MDMTLQQDILKEIAETLIDDKVHQILHQSAVKRYETTRKIQHGHLSDTDISEDATMSAYLYIKPRLIHLLRQSHKLNVDFEPDELVDAVMTELFQIEDNYLEKLQEG